MAKVDAGSPPAELYELARPIVWFEPPAKALFDPARFLVYLMTYGTAEDIAEAKRHFTEADFAGAIRNAPPGIFDARSWAYWNLMVGRYPAPQLPKRQIPG